MATFSKGINFTKSDLVTCKENTVPIILYGSLYTEYKLIIKGAKDFTQTNKKAVFSNYGDVIIPASGETSEDIVRASVVKNSGIILGSDLNIVKPLEKLDSTFLALAISYGEERQKLMKRAQGKSVVHLRNSDLKTIILGYPSFQEQQKIGLLFEKLDQEINLYKQKLEKIKQLKKAYLQKMFC